MPQTQKSGAPQKMSFDSGFLSDTGALAVDDARIDPAVRSFMDKGESAFENEEGREDVAAGVRNTLLARMRDENLRSVSDAYDMEHAHTLFTDTEMLPLIAKAKSKVRESNTAVAEYYLAKSRLSSRDAEESLAAANLLIQGIRPPLPSADPVPPANASIDIQDGSDQGSEAEASELSEDAGLQPEGGIQPEIQAPGQQQAGAEEAPVFSDADDTALRGNDLRRLEHIRTEITANTRRNRGALMKFFTAVNYRRTKAERSMNSARAEVDEISRRIITTANRWDHKRSDYRKTTFKKRYEYYDHLAKTYYTLSRRVDPAARTIDQVLGENGGGSAKKRIAEYIGVYSLPGLEQIIRDLKRNPYSPAPDLRPVKKRALKEGSLNAEDDFRPVKYHQVMAFKAYAEGISNRTEYEQNDQHNIRVKLLSDFRGYRARIQRTAKTGTAMTDTGLSRAERGKMTAEELRENTEQRLIAENQGEEAPGPLGAAASDLNLIVDEKGANNEYILSESSAMIHQARVRNAFGRNIRGFYIGGEFFSEDYTAMQQMDQSSIIGTPNWNRINQEEKLRIAIRRSDFFRHVNAATIQYYTSYNAANIADTESIRQKLKGPAKEEAADKEEAVDEADPLSAFDDARTAVIMLDAYIERKAALEAAGKFINEDSLEVLETALRALAEGNCPPDDKRELGILLLAEEDPELWDTARQYAMQLGGRFSFRAKRLPASGELMRMGLLEEFANPRAFSFMDIGKSLRPDKLNIRIEDLSAKRGGFFSLTNFRQSFWDGSLTGALSGSFAALSADVDTIPVEGDINYICNEFTRRYSEVAAKSATNWTAVLAPIPLIVTAATGGIEVKENETEDAFAYRPSESASASLSALGTIQSALGFVQHLAKLVDTIKNTARARSNGEPVWPMVADIFCLIVDLISDIVNIIFWWLKTPVMKGVVKVFAVVQNIIAIIKGITDSIKATREINKITASDNELETAMTQYAQRSAELKQNGQEAGEAEMEDTTQKLGLASADNSQGKYFLSLAKSRARKKRKMAVAGIAANTVDAIGNSLAAGTRFSWLNPISFPFKLAAKATAFIGWVVGKAHDRAHFAENVAMTLGNPDYAGYAGFNEALKRETGINNKHYLVDLARIFMAIDTHHLIRKPGKTDGETALAISLMRPYLKIAGEGNESFAGDNLEANREKLRSVKLEKIMAAVGGPGNWRAVLRSSIAG